MNGSMGYVYIAKLFYKMGDPEKLDPMYIDGYITGINAVVEEITNLCKDIENEHNKKAREDDEWMRMRLADFFNSLGEDNEAD